MARRRQAPPLAPVPVPLWSVVCGLDWTIVAALTKRNAELLVYGHYVEAGRSPDIRWRIKATRATAADIERCQAIAATGVPFGEDDGAAALLSALPVDSPPAADEPDQLLLFAGN